MPRQTKHSWGGLLTAGLVAGAFLSWNGGAFGQMQGGSSGGFGGTSGGFGSTGTGSSFGGTSTSGFGGSSSGFGGSSISGGSGGIGSSFGSSGQGTTGSSGFGGTFGTTGSNFRSTTGGGGFTGGTSYSVSPSNAFGTYYVNPLSLGMAGSTGRSSFGTPLYNITSTTTGTTSGITGSFNTGSTYSQGSLGGTSGQLSVPYVASLDTNFSGNTSGPVITSGRLLTELRQVLARSTSLPSRDRIQVAMQGGVVILQGTVSDEHERRLAAGLVSLSPGVHGIRNDLKVSGAAAGPTSP